MPSSTTTRTSTCPSMGAGQETTGPADTTRYSDEIVLSSALHKCVEFSNNLMSFFSLGISYIQKIGNNSLFISNISLCSLLILDM